MEDGRRADFDRLIVFPTDELITERRFAAFYNNNKFLAKSSLEFLAARRCILERRENGFTIHDLWADVVRQRVTSEQQKEHVATFC